MRKRKIIEKIKKPKTFEEYMEWQIQKGYITKNGLPLKCSKCGCKKLKDCDFYYENHSVIEHSTKCKSCGDIVGHWAYGYWQI